MKNPLIKDTFREIKKNKGRFFSIFAIITLGVAFFTGIKVAAPVMKHTADKYYDEKNLMDLTLISNLGITDKDIDELSKVKDIENIYPTYSKDVLTNIDNKELVLKMHGIPKSNNKNNINQVNLVEGRYPTTENECLVEGGNALGTDIKIGTKIKVYADDNEDINDTLKYTEYEVVGKVESPYYISHAKGNSSIGSGQLNSYMLVPDSNFKLDAYTEALVTIIGSKEFNSYSKEYEDYIKDNKGPIEDLGKIRATKRYEEVLSQAREEIEEGRKKLEDEKSNAENELNKAENDLKKAEIELNKGIDELNKKENEFNNTINLAYKKIKEENNNLDKLEKELEEKYREFNSNKQQIQQGINTAKENLNAINTKKEELENNISNIEEALKNPNLDEESKNKLQQELKISKSGLESLNTEIKRLNDTIVSQESFIKETEQTLLASIKGIDDGKLEIKKQKENLIKQEETAKKGFNEARQKLDKGKIDLENGKKEYEESKEKAYDEIAKAEEEINKGEKELEDIKEGKWYVLDRNTNYGFVDYKNSTESINAISKIFPVFFFSLAALICLTTMTRMVDEQRINIGTMKALGYSSPLIMFKYIVYALLASVLGSIVGSIIGFTIFPYVIFNAYASMTYILPNVSLLFDFKLTIIATLIGVLTTTLAVVFSCSKELIEVPSLLMRPKAPKEGKRILIERIPFIWNRLGFIQKVTCRNIFRYKKRFFMTVIGIAGCSSLLVTGFGIRDSISSIVDNQYGEIFKYNGNLSYKVDIESGQKSNVHGILEKDKRIIDFENIHSKSFKVINNSIKKDATIIVPENSNKLNEFIALKNRVTNKEYKLSNEGVLITEKLAKLLDAKVNDTISLENEDNEKFEVKIEGIVENYVGHYIYLSCTMYENLFNEKLSFNQAMIKTLNNELEFEEKLGNDLIKLDDISSATFNTASKESFSSMISNLNSVVILIILSAGTLAFIVLYNLTNVNISERIREIATIKVLGFYDGEVSSYVFRENIILTIIGTLVGLFLGIFLHRFIMTTAELEFTMFGRDIKTFSFIMSGVLTMVFAGIVNLCMYNKLKDVKMVESLKSVD